MFFEFDLPNVAIKKDTLPVEPIALVNEHRSNHTESLNIKRWRLNLQNLICTESFKAVSDEGDEIHSFLAHFPPFVRMCEGCHL